jgi:DNA-binding LacI/PurR family transcriptional regulator
MPTLTSQARQFVLAGIRTGQYPVHTALPPVDALASALNCSIDTVRRALRELTREGTLSPGARGGTFVARVPAHGRVGILLAADASLNRLLQEPITRTCVEAGYDVDVLEGMFDETPRGSQAAPPIASPLPSALIILTPWLLSAPARQQLAALAPREPRLIYLDLERSEGLPAGAHICIDWAAAARAVICHLKTLGHRHIGAYGGLHGPGESTYAAETTRTLMTLCELAGMVCVPYYWYGGQGPLPDFLHGRHLTAYWASTDARAVSDIQQCQQAGLLVPEQMSIIGRGDLPCLSDERPSLTTISLNPDGLTAAVRLALTADSLAHNPVFTVPPRLVPRCTTGWAGQRKLTSTSSHGAAD